MINKSVLLITYKPRDTTLKLIREILSENGVSLYIAIDGPKNQKEQEKIDRFLKTISQLHTEYPENRIRIWKRRENLGLAVSVITAIDWFFYHEESGIVLEDDLEVSEGFFKYVSDNEKLLSPSSILMIGGHQPFSGIILDENVISSYPQVWGWASNKICWGAMRKLILNNGTKSLVKNRVQAFWKTGSDRAHSGYLDSWAVPLAQQMRENHLFCLMPSISLIRNLGFDENATHTFFEPEIKSKVEINRMEMVNIRGQLFKSIDKLLEKHVYKIKRTQLLRYFFHKRIDSFRERKYKVNLSERIGSIEFPKEK